MKRAAMTLALVLMPAAGALAATVTGLKLPAGFTVQPEGEDRRISIAPDRTVAALSTDGRGRERAFRWKPDGTRSAFTPLPVLTAPDRGESPGIAFSVGGIASGPGTTYVSATESFSGAYGGISFEVQRWVGDAALRWHLPACVKSGDGTDQHAYAVDAQGRIALTMDTTGRGSFMVLSDETGALAPYAFVIDGTACRALGRGVVLHVRDRWAAGYVGYLDGHPAATATNPMALKPVALRWHDAARTVLGNGAAYAVTSGGFTVGASARAGQYELTTTNLQGGPAPYDWLVPHALAWDARGRRIALERGERRSVAYDIADDGTAFGMLQSVDGKHFAFRWRAGRLQRLDDLPHPPGWRFESAYAVAPDGTVAGIGTYNGIATVFTWRE
jgi:hypothetical protein